jgi:hypothetical protein
LYCGDRLTSPYSELERKILNLLTRTKTSRRENEIIINGLKEFRLFNKLDARRDQDYQNILGYASYFQQTVHEFFEDNLKLNFDSEKSVRHAIGKKEIEINGAIKDISPNLRFDGYTRLTKAFKDFLDLQPKWKAIAFEAHGMWHVDRELYKRMFPYKTDFDFDRRQLVDQLKRDIYQKEDIILIEIYENIKKSEWISKIIEQIKIQTGVELTRQDVESLNNFLGGSDV